MKKIKQIISIILAILMLITTVPMQSFAAFDFFYPTVDKIEYAKDVKPLSYKEIIAQSKESDDGYVYNSFDAGFDVYFSDGKKLENVNYSIIGYKGVEAIAFNECINSAECTEAINQGKTTVNVDVNVSVVYRGRPTVYKTFTLERPIVKEFVKNITFVDTLPEIKEDDYNINFNFVGKKFEIEYADGTKKVAAVEETEFDFLLDGESISIYNRDSYYYDDVTGEKIYYTGITVEFMDEKIIIDKQEHICNYSSIEISDYSFNNEGKLASITYRLTHKDGNVIEKTNTIDEGVKADTFDGIIVDTIDGYDVKVNVYVSPAIFRKNSSCYITVNFGLDGWNLNGSETIYDFNEICDCRCHRSGIIYIFNQIVFKLQEIFGRETECRCGTAHSAVS